MLKIQYYASVLHDKRTKRETVKQYNISCVRAAMPCSISPSLGPFSPKYLLQVDAGSESYARAAIILLEWVPPCSQEHSVASSPIAT